MKNNTEITAHKQNAEYAAPEIVQMGKVVEITAGQGGESKDSTDTCIPVSRRKP
jgi:hypothetical protein